MHFNTTRAPDVFNDWVFWASYVNNFVYTARSLECDAFLGAEFDSARAVAEPFDEAATEIRLSAVKKAYTMHLPYPRRQFGSGDLNGLAARSRSW